MKLYKIPEGRIDPSAVIQEAYDRASNQKVDDLPITASAVSSTGARFRIPVLVPVGEKTGDGRYFSEGALTTRELPLPLLWQFKTGSGHDGSVVIGRIDSVEITPEGLVNALGVLDTNPYALEVERMIRHGFLRGVSADLDEFTASEESDISEFNSENDEKIIKNKPLRIDEARLMGVTVVSLPAFYQSFIELLDEEMEFYPMEDGIYTADEDYVDVVVASAAPIAPPREWFQNPKLSGPTPLTVDDNGKVFGHLALFESNHIGMNGNVKPPRSSNEYKYFRTGVVRADDGTDVTTGSITLVGGHAPIHLSAREAVRHYDETKSAVMDVTAGEDKFGIWISGTLRPDVSPEQIRSLRASGISGDWRPINGRLELVSACAVNTPGFPVVRAMVSSGQVQALVAAGTATLNEMSTKRLFSEEFDATVTKLNSRVDYALNRVEYDTKADNARDRINKSKIELANKKISDFKEQRDLDRKLVDLRNRFNTK